VNSIPEDAGWYIALSLNHVVPLDEWGKGGYPGAHTQRPATAAQARQ